ncbi:histidine kinase [Pedobacter steynii]|uniref:Signal transduction histidine kinase internal region domain-containing protein n=1 Tax=Pedobacter steynii TaxID=430522 RepID=A0A1D7QN09_9SPHI|nr:histidine kinase [Pedobacter steynii]AOM80050.1 hypothetical protein BFS30_24530 [Pedobacter steynii]
MNRKLRIHTLLLYLKATSLKLILLHIFGVMFIIGSQMLLIISAGLNITFKGWLIFVLQTLTFYAGIFWLIPIRSPKTKIIAFVGRLSVLIIGYGFLRGWIIIGGFWHADFWKFVILYDQLVLTSLQLMLVLILSFYIWLYQVGEIKGKQLVIANRKASEALEEKLRIESIMSQLQLSPHHLFGSLNYIKVKSETTNPDIAQIADLLSAILRHTLIDLRKIKKVYLSDEIDLVYNYIELHKKRSKSRVHIDYIDQFKNVGIENKIPPSILLTLTDNVLKYAILNDPDTPAQICLRQESGFMIFHTFNHKRGFPLPGRGIGLKSVRTILDYYYPEHYSLEIADNEETYSLTLKIKL